MRTTIIADGTKSIGLAIGKELAGEGEVILAGAKDPQVPATNYYALGLKNNFKVQIRRLIHTLDHVSSVFCIGYSEKMSEVLVDAVLLKQETLAEVVAVQLSQGGPTGYSFLKDKRIFHSLVVEMKNINIPLSEGIQQYDMAWIVNAIVQARGTDYSMKRIRLNGRPRNVELVEIF